MMKFCDCHMIDLLTGIYFLLSLSRTNFSTLGFNLPPLQIDNDNQIFLLEATIFGANPNKNFSILSSTRDLSNLSFDLGQGTYSSYC